MESALSGILQEKKKSVIESLSSSKVKLSTILLGYQGNLLSAHKETREKTVDRIMAYMKACADLGGIGVVTIPSHRKKRRLFSFLTGDSKEIKKDLAVQQYKLLGKYAQDLGVYIIIEPVDHFQTDFINTCDEAVELCRNTGSDMVKICPDLFHMSIEEPNINEKIRELHEYIVHLHMGDNDRKSRFAVLPSRGNLDFRGILEALRNINYSNYLSFDCRIPSEEELDSSIQFLRKLRL